MKIVLTGSSGFVGGEILNHCLSDPSIFSILVLSRRALPEIAAKDPRIKILVIQDFTNYPPNVIDELVNVEACIWSLGGSNSNPTPSGKCDEVEVQYPIALANALLSSPSSSTKVRFVFISGSLSVRNQEKQLWFLSEGRKARGLAETRLIDLAAKSNGKLTTIIAKSGYVLKSDSALPELSVSLTGGDLAIRVGELAVAMVDLAIKGINGGNDSGTVGNKALRNLGKRLLREEK